MGLRRLMASASLCFSTGVRTLVAVVVQLAAVLIQFQMLAAPRGSDSQRGDGELRGKGCGKVGDAVPLTVW